MSSKNRRELFAKQNLLTPTEETKSVTFKESDSALYAGTAMENMDTGDRVNVRPVPIFHLYPDLNQPRRALPSLIRAEWDGNPSSLQNLFELWQDAVNQERKHQGKEPNFEIVKLLKLEVQATREDTETLSMGALEQTFLELIYLAGSIYRDKLTNAITAVRLDGDVYRIETGERRWLAYHLLALVFPSETQWKKIPTRLVDHFNVWRQASENAERHNLNGIGKARQFAVLLMDLLKTERAMEFQPLNTFEHEHHFYAQVADLEPPYGKGEVLRNTLQVQSRQSLSRYRTLLRLDDRVWTMGDDYNVSERFLEELSDIAPEKALQLIESSRARDSLPKVLKRPTEQGERIAPKPVVNTMKQILKQTEFPQDPKDARKQIEKVEHLMDWLNEYLEALKRVSN
jgi:hypothetical protein